MKTLYLKGDPYSIGLQTGKTFSKQIKEYISFRKQELMRELQFEGVDVSYQEIYSQIYTFARQPAIQDDTFAELTGVSDGSEVDLTDIFICIGYTDILDYCISCFGSNVDNISFSNEKNQECSIFAFISSDGLIVGQNWDMDKVSGDNRCLLIKKYDSGAQLISLTTVLGATHIGMNHKGYSVGTANLSYPINQLGLIFPQIIQRMLMYEDRDIFHRNNRMAGHFYYIGYPNQQCSLIETTCDSFYSTCLNSSNNLQYAHTNHYLHKWFKDKGVNYSSSSELRKMQLEDLMQKHAASFDIEKFKTDLGKHEFGLCRHSSPESSIQTCASVIFMPDKKTMLICDGSPCNSKWESYNMEYIFQ